MGDEATDGPDHFKSAEPLTRWQAMNTLYSPWSLNHCKLALWSWRSRYGLICYLALASVASMLCVASIGSFASCLSIGSFFSLTSIFSVFSINSTLAVASVNSYGSYGSVSSHFSILSTGSYWSVCCVSDQATSYVFTVCNCDTGKP